jgi:class 3 adenylate cyclase
MPKHVVPPAEHLTFTAKDIERVFGPAVAPEVLTQILNLNPPLSMSTNVRTATILFSDVRNATGLADEQGAENARLILSEFLEVVSAEAMARGGYVDKYVGDEAMIIFGAPVPSDERTQALAAADLAIAVQDKARAMKLPIGIGIHTGEMTLGCFGSRSRPDYSAFGDEVNVAACLEVYTKRTNGRTGISRRVRDLIDDEYRAVFVSERQPNSASPSAPIDVFCIVGRRQHLSEAETAFWDRYDYAMQLTNDGQSGAALAVFTDLLSERPADGLLLTARSRAERLYAEAMSTAFRAAEDGTSLATQLAQAIATLFGDCEVAFLEESLEGVWRFRNSEPFAFRETVLSSSGDGLIWIRGLLEAAATKKGPEAIRQLGFDYVAPLRKDNELAGAMFLKTATSIDLLVLSTLGDALADSWVAQQERDLRSRYREKADDADKLASLNRELEEKSRALEKTVAENQELNRTLEQRVAAHAARLQRATALKRYLPPSVVESIIDGSRDLAPTTERRKITVLFSDVHGFTSATDGLEPEELARLLNSYLSAMSEIAFSAGATIDKFRGDGMMVFFGAPEPIEPATGARACLSMAIEMCREIKNLRSNWFSDGYDWELGVRIGINTGYATVGEFGSAQRLDYTAIGTEVNLAARLEAAAETDSILISHATWALVRDEFECASVGQLELKGIQRKVRAYSVDWRK